MDENPNTNSNNKKILNTKLNNEIYFNELKNFINIIPPNNIRFDYDLYEISSLFSKIFFLYGYNILKIAKKYKLEIKHLGKVNDNNNCKNFFKEIESFWEEKNYKNIKKMQSQIINFIDNDSSKLSDLIKNWPWNFYFSY